MDNEYNGVQPENGQGQNPQEAIFRAETEEVESFGASNQGANMQTSTFGANNQGANMQTSTFEVNNQGANMQTSTFEVNNQGANMQTSTFEVNNQSANMQTSIFEANNQTAFQDIGYPEEEKPSEKSVDGGRLKKILCSVGIGLVALFMLLVFLQTVLMSMTNYSPLKGLLGSGWVGFDNYRKVFTMQYFTRLLSNSVVISLIGIVVGAVYVFLASLSITNIKNAFGKAVVLAIYILPTVFSATLYANLVPSLLRLDPTLMRVLVAVSDGLRLSGFVIVAAFFVKGNSIAESAKCMLLFIAVRLIMFFTFENGLILTSYSPATYETLDVLGTFSFRTGVKSAGFSIASAVHIIKTLFQIIPAVLGCTVIALISRPKEKKSADGSPIPLKNKTYSGALVALGAMVVPIVLFAAVLISGPGIVPQTGRSFYYLKYCINGLYIAFVSALIVSAVSFGIAKLASNSGILGIICVTLGVMLGNDLVTTYIFCRDVRNLDTYKAVFILNTYMIPLIALLMTYIFKNGKDLLRDLGVFAVFFALLVGWFWGEAYMPSIALMNEDLIPISVLMRKLFISNSPEYVSGNFDYATRSLPADVPTAMFVIMFGVIVVVGFCLLAALTVNRKKKEI